MEKDIQQDNASCHKVKMVQQWLEEQNKEFEVLTGPPKSTDLNPIQHSIKTHIMHGTKD